MIQHQINKKKIINDPVLGFINLQSELIFDLIEHPYFQRLRRIRQLGLSFLVFPGANHSRFEHALGTIHLMRQAISVLKLKGHEITDEEADAVTAAILLHDIGHAPFSHVLENTLVKISHEQISLLMMEELNQHFGGKLDLAIRIFTNKYKKQFLHQLVSGQLDMDRLDYLNRDSFFTGVAEGTIGVDRIIKMLNVWKDQLVVDEKGIYSIEKFLISRRLMYWQVYLHKTVVSAESLLINVLQRAREISVAGEKIYSTPALQVFLNHNISQSDFEKNSTIDGDNILNWYAALDDNDISIALKIWQNHPDLVLSKLSQSLMNRKLFKITLSTTPFEPEMVEKINNAISSQITTDRQLASYFIMSGEITNKAYNKHNEKILVLDKSGFTKEMEQASDINLMALTKTVRKYYLCYPKELVVN
ncbi:MAG: HD domain-containing protein [Draconibacterium sp.]